MSVSDFVAASLKGGNKTLVSRENRLSIANKIRDFVLSGFPDPATAVDLH